MRRPKSEMADWHITLRGARRLALFHDQEDYSTFYGMLGNACAASGTDQIANCLMTNHFHLALAGSSKQVATCMQRLNYQYSYYHNDRYGLSGHAFEQEYYRDIVPSLFVLKRVERYIHLNPVRAGICQGPEAYPWSSYGRILGALPTMLTTSERRYLAGYAQDLAVARDAYRQFVHKDLDRPQPIQPVAKTSAWEIWQEQFQWFLETTKEHEEKLRPLACQDVAAWWAVQSGIPPRVIGKALGDRNGRRISQVCVRVAHKLERDLQLEARVRSLAAL